MAGDGAARDPDETLVTEGAGPVDPDAGPGLPIDRFTLGPELGRGGMGRVVSAHDRSLDRTVAIKQALGTDPTDLARFEREARITARLEHPSIVPVHEAGHDAQGRPYYVMRKIEGRPLSERIAAAAGTRERLALVPNVLAAVEAIAFAHARGVIHRDLKPLNLLIGAYGETLVIDWGLARELDGDVEVATEGATASGEAALTEVGQAYGTPGYMAPEQARGERVDLRTDVYQLGATLFHVLAGVTPFEGIPRSAWVERSILGAAPQIERIGPEVPVELVAIVVKAMRVEAGERYRDAGELAVDLRRFLTGQLVAAHHYTPRERIARFVRRHRIALAVSAIALVAAGVLGALAIRRIVEERDRANAGQDLAAERADRLLLDRAATLVTTVPTRAVALLAHLPASSPSWPRARDLAAAAAAAGIRRGVATTQFNMSALQISPDGEHLLTAGFDPTIRVHDLATAATHAFALPVTYVDVALWIDDRTIAFTDSLAIYVLDLATAKTRQLVAGLRLDTLWVAADRLRYLDRARRELVEIALTGERAVLAQDVDFADGADDLVVYETTGSLRLLVGTRTLTLREHLAPAPGQLRLFAISPDHGHVATQIAGSVIEFATATGEVSHEIAVPLVTSLFYGASDLLAIIRNPFGTLVALEGKAPAELYAGRWSVVWTARTRDATAIVGDDGTVLVLDETGAHRLVTDRTDTRLVAVRAGSPYLAIGSRDGTVSWWDLRVAAPAPRPLPLGTRLCTFDADKLYLIDGTMSAVYIDRHADTTARLNGPTFVNCIAVVGHHMIAIRGGFDDLHSIDMTNGHTEALSRAVVDRRGASVLEYLPEPRTIVEHVHGESPPRLRWRAPADVSDYRVSGPWLAAQLADGSIRRIDATGEAGFVWSPANAALVGVGPSGDVWFCMGASAWRWRDGIARPIATLSAPIDRVFDVAGEVVVQLDDFSVWLITDHGPVERMETSGDVTVMGPTFGARRANHTVTTIYPATGVKVTRRSESATGVAIDDAGRSIAVVTLHPLHDLLTIYDDPVPADPAAARAWVLAATNAVLDPATDAMTWR